MIPLHFEAAWAFEWVDASGNVVERRIPAGTRGVELAADAAAAALAEGVAKPLRPIPAELAGRIDHYKSMMALAARGLTADEIVEAMSAVPAPAANAPAPVATAPPVATAAPVTSARPSKAKRLKSAAT